MKQKAESSLQNGRTIGNYVLTRNLGEGTFGKVKLGIHNLTGEKVAVKVLEKSKIVDVADVERVTREIHILKQIRHPSIIQLYEIIETPKQLFLVMEYVSQGELFQLIVKKKRLKEAEACEFFHQIIAGVEYLHELGIVHRDLKPENLLIDFNRRLKIVDFGLSNTYKTKEVLKTACGSPCYAAPQMIAGKKYLGLNADIWSCGVILFAMVCGYLPFEDPNTALLYKKITAGDFILPKFISPIAKDLIQALLTTDPDRRIRLKDIKNHPWFTQASPKSAIGIKIGMHHIPVDPSILSQLAQYNQNVKDSRKCIQNNRHNHSITIYYLLLKKQLRSGIESEYDICSTAFNHKHLHKEEKPVSDAKGEKSQSTNPNDLEEIQLDRMTTALPRSNRIKSRLVHLRENKGKEAAAQSIEVKFDDNLPSVDKMRGPTRQKRRVHQLILNKEGKKGKVEQPEQTSLYDIEQRPASKFRQTISSGWKKPTPSLSVSVNKSQQRQQRREERANSQRYRSVQITQRDSSPFQDNAINIMNKTFMGKIPKAYIPRWENESERIRSILNTTVSGKRKHKFNFYY